jgi:hypothetical protein
MTDTWGTRQQPSDPGPDPGRLRPEHFYLLGAVVFLTAAGMAYIVDMELPFDLNRGAYAILVGLFVVGGCGWLARSGQRKMREDNARVLAEVVKTRAEVAELRDARRPPAQAPPWDRASPGHTYTSHMALADTVPQVPNVDSARIREAAAVEGFELGYRARDAEETTAVTQPRTLRLTRDS